MRVAGGANWYRTERIAHDVTLIEEHHIKPFYRCNMWHLRGRDRDLLLDSGLGHFSLRRHVSLVSEKPVVCVASHTHFDHIGCHHEFSDRRVHAAEADILARPDRALTLAATYADERMFDALPGAEPSTYEGPARRPTKDGDALTSDGLEVIHTPGHSPGGIALWERKTGILLSGDIVYDGPLILDTYHADLSDYDTSMARLERLPVEIVHGGHFPSFGHDRLKELIREYRKGRREAGCHLAAQPIVKSGRE
jgi:glyoxylase-like metal-dependent hydrolase (beta-lactamase superfamily II)